MTTAATCPDCHAPLTLERVIEPGVVAEFVVTHRVLSANRFDPATVVIRGTTKHVPAGSGLVDDPFGSGGKSLRRLAVEQVAASFVDESDCHRGGTVDAGDLTARLTRRRTVTAQRIMACTVCVHTHREPDPRYPVGR